MDNFRAFELTIQRFVSTLLPLHQLAATMPDDKHTLYMIHSLAYGAMIRLHQPFIADDQLSREKSVRAARSIAMVAKHVTDPDFEYLDPLMGVRTISLLIFNQTGSLMFGLFFCPCSIVGYLLHGSLPLNSLSCGPLGRRSTYLIFVPTWEYSSSPSTNSVQDIHYSVSSTSPLMSL